MNLHADVNLVDHPISIVKSIFHRKNLNNHDWANNENHTIICFILYATWDTLVFIDNVFSMLLH